MVITILCFVQHKNGCSAQALVPHSGSMPCCSIFPTPVHVVLAPLIFIDHVPCHLLILASISQPLTYFHMLWLGSLPSVEPSGVNFTDTSPSLESIAYSTMHLLLLNFYCCSSHAMLPCYFHQK